MNHLPGTSAALCFALLLAACGGDSLASAATSAASQPLGSSSGRLPGDASTDVPAAASQTGATSGPSEPTTAGSAATDPIAATSEGTSDTSTTSSSGEPPADTSASSGADDKTTGAVSDCPPEKTIVVPDNESLLLDEPADVQALAGIECIAGRVQLHGGAGSLQPLLSLRQISDWLALEGEGFAEGLLGLENLESIGGLTLYDTDLIDLSGLDGLQQSGQIDLHLNSQLVSLDGLDSLHAIAGGLYLGSSLKGANGKLASIAALAALTTISGDLEIHGSSLPDLTGLAQLESVGGSAHIQGNKQLPTCLVVAFVTDVDITGPVEISANLKDQCGG